MNKKIDNGGPAFPRATEYPTEPGMTWLDYAAIQIAAGWYANHHCNNAEKEANAQASYQIAEALLAEKRRLEK